MHFYTLISTGFHVGPHDGLIFRPEKSYLVCVCLTECDHIQDNPLHPRVGKIGHAKKYAYKQMHITRKQTRFF